MMKKEKKHERITAWRGTFIKTMIEGHWEFVQRHGLNGIVGIVAITDEPAMVLVEQYRVPTNSHVIEIPAGISGDGGHNGEDLVLAAQRELFEETGYQAETWQALPCVTSSPGLTDEATHLFLATGLKRIENGGGDVSEHINVHTVTLNRIEDWLNEQAAQGKLIDAKVYSGLFLAMRNLGIINSMTGS